MKKEFEKIIENELFFKELAAKQFSENEDITRENVKEYLIKQSKRIRGIINDTNVLIDKYVTPFLKDPTAFKREEAMEFQDFAEKLSGYKENIDTGLSCDIRDALIQYSVHVKDDELYIHNMFYKGLALFYLDKVIFKDEMSDCYAKVLSFSDRYTEFSRDIRNLIVRAHGNYYISVKDNDIDEIYCRYDKASNFWNNVGKKVDPDFNWDAYANNMHENICSATISTLRSAKGPSVHVKYRKRLLESAQYLYERGMKDGDIQSNDYTSVQSKLIYYQGAAKYYNGLITKSEFLKKLFSIYRQAGNEYDYDNLYKKLHISALYLYYLSHDTPKEISEKERAKITVEIEKNVLEYIQNIPDNISQAYVTNMVANFALGSQKVLTDTTYLKLILSMTVFRHLPTYVHSVLVAKISYVITEYLIKYLPETLVGMPGINSVEDVKHKEEEILRFVWYCGLIHDIGKIVYSHLVSFYVRKLNDKEFQMIKEHSFKADNFIKPAISSDFDINLTTYDIKITSDMKIKEERELFDCFSDIAFGHHKSYDGKFGYPREFDNVASPVKIIIDIISIADSIDAATDSVGRSYANEKFLSDMREDLLSQIHTRYNPEVTKMIFENKQLYDAINKIINEYRYNTYYTCFLSKDYLKTMVPPTEKTFL